MDIKELALQLAEDKRIPYVLRRLTEIDEKSNELVQRFDLLERGSMLDSINAAGSNAITMRNVAQTEGLLREYWDKCQETVPFLNHIEDLDDWVLLTCDFPAVQQTERWLFPTSGSLRVNKKDFERSRYETS